MDDDENEFLLSLFNDDEYEMNDYKIDTTIKIDVVKDKNVNIEYKILSALLFMSNLSKENYILTKTDKQF